MNIVECFISVQGEGLRAGRPSLFIRTSGCNLRCVFHNEDGKASSTCDTSYASFNPTNEKKQVVELLKQNGAKIVTLGNRILRTETVALNVLSVIMYELEQTV